MYHYPKTAMEIKGFGFADSWQEVAYGFCKDAIDMIASKIKYVIIKPDNGNYDDMGFTTRIYSQETEEAIGYVTCQYQGNDIFEMSFNDNIKVIGSQKFGLYDNYKIVATKLAKKIDDSLGS